MLSWSGTLPAFPGPPSVDATREQKELIARAQEDRDAFAALYDRYLGSVYGYCYNRLGSREAAEDATSQTFYNALRALPGFQVGSFHCWLFTIAHNVIVDMQRRQRPQEPLEAAGDPADAAPTPEELALLAEERRSLRAALAALSPDQRRVVELRLAGFSGAEIAETLGRSLASVKMLQFRALERLRLLLRAPASGEEVRNGGER